MKRITHFAIGILLILVISVSADQPNFPFMAGELVDCVNRDHRGYYDIGYYGYDLVPSQSTYNNQCGFPIVAPISGTVWIDPRLNGQYAVDICGPVAEVDNHGLGITIHIIGDNDIDCLLMHFMRLYIMSGERVERGQVIGILGDTGYSWSENPPYRFPHTHLHSIPHRYSYQQISSSTDDMIRRYGWVTNSRDYRFVENNSAWPSEWTDNLSQNSFIFDTRLSTPLHGRSVTVDFDDPNYTENNILDIHWYFDYDPNNSYETYHGYGFSLNTYKVDFSGGSIWDGVIVYDALGGAKQAYVVGWNEWDRWQNLGASPNETGLGGPNSCLYNPISNSYWSPSAYAPGNNCWRQDFPPRREG